MNDGFYRSFEEKYRGSRELIKSRLLCYRPFIEPLAEAYSGGHALDIGCGRGEWLEIMSQFGLKPFGIDLDQGMLDNCLELGLKAEKAEATAFLATLPDESHVVISAFHVVEHIPFHKLKTIVSEAFRVLKPGGLLIMETPNPENIIVATRKFYFDPTHRRPIPSELLSFLPQFYGFFRTKILRLQEPELLKQAVKQEMSLLDVLDGVSPDYAVVAQKNAEDSLLVRLDAAFSKEYGLTLETLASRYQEQLSAKIGHKEAGCQQNTMWIIQQAEASKQQALAAEARSAEQEQRAIAAEARSAEQEQRAIAAETSIHYWQQQTNEWHERILALHNSTSWKITKPLRAIKRLLTRDFTTLGRSTAPVKLKAKQTFRPLLSSSIKYVFNKPVLRKILSSALKYFPGLHQRLLRVAVNTGVVECGKGYLEPMPSNLEQSILPHELQTMTPRARQIYQDLKAAIEKKNKGAA